eukprot:2659179-Alexandrium_andersonii.AAC.1
MGIGEMIGCIVVSCIVAFSPCIVIYRQRGHMKDEVRACVWQWPVHRKQLPNKLRRRPSAYYMNEYAYEMRGVL